MMEKFRNLGHNIFFKIFLGFLGLTFVLFGISGFLLGGNNSWIAKVGDKTVSYDKFLQTLQSDRDMIYRSNQSREAMEYLNSDQFRKDTLEKMVTKNLIQSLQEEFQIYPDQDLILKEIVASPVLRGANGKFDRNIYRNFLRSNGITEKQHLNELAQEVVGAMILQAFAYSPNVNPALVKDIYQHRFQTRSADVITILSKNVGDVGAPNDFELNEFFAKNKEQFSLPEYRKVSFVAFDVNNLKQEIKITDEEILSEYENNKSDYQLPETVNFYHILFSEEAEANEFLKSLNADNSKNKSEAFVKLADAKGKDKSAISLNKISKKELPTEIANSAFALEKNQASKVLKSKIGFHIFYVLDKNPASDVPLAKAKEQIRNKLAALKSENQVQDNLKKIEDEILASNSISKVAARLKTEVRTLPKFSSDGLDVKKKKIAEIAALEDFAKNAFALEKDKVSKIFTSTANKKYYVLIVEDLEPQRKRSLDEVKVFVTDLWIVNQKQQKLRELASQVSKALNQNGGDASAVASKFNVKLEKNRSFTRFSTVDIGNGRTVPYATKMQNAIFDAKLNKATNPEIISSDEIQIAVVKNIKNPAINAQDLKTIEQELRENFKNDVLISFNDYVTEKFPVKINEKLIQSQTE